MTSEKTSVSRPNRIDHRRTFTPYVSQTTFTGEVRRIPDFIWFTEDEQGRTWCSFREGPASKEELEEIIRLATLARETALSDVEAAHARGKDCENPDCPICDERYWEAVAVSTFRPDEHPKADKAGVVYLARSGDSYRLGCTSKKDLRPVISRLQSEIVSTVTLVHSAPSSAMWNSKYEWQKRFVRAYESGGWFKLNSAEVGDFRAWVGDVE
jgi:hypothetical protein